MENSRFKMSNLLAYNFLKTVCRLMDYFRGLLLYISIRLCGGVCQGIPRVGKGVTLKYPPHSGFKLGRYCEIGPSCYLDIPLGSKFALGNNVKLTACVVISAANEVSIGSDTLVAEFVSIRDSQHFYLKETKIREQGLLVGRVEIGSDVWIGCGAMILCDVSLNDGCVIGAGTLVKNEKLEKFGVYAGAPARLIKRRDTSNDR